MITGLPIRIFYGQAALPGSCGELVQGSLDGIPCLVSCPIDRYSRANISAFDTTDWLGPVDSPKALAALKLASKKGFQHFGGGTLRLVSDLPRGRGYASSTADIGAALFALSRAAGVDLTSESAAGLAVQVEPSDSTLFSGLALFEHRSASFMEELGPAPAVDVLVIDPGGQIDTLAFNQIEHSSLLRRLAPEHKTAFNLLKSGLQKKDLRALGEATSLSAGLHQVILYNPWLDWALAQAKNLNALGVCRAHSGTILGLLFDPLQSDLDDIKTTLSHHLPGQLSIFNQKMVNGGPVYDFANPPRVMDGMADPELAQLEPR